jgi:rod shape determining protein RodA
VTQWRTLRNFDPWIVVIGLVLAFYGALLIYSASRTVYPDGIQGLGHPAVRHLVIATLGVAVVAGVAWFDYRTLGQVSPTIYAVALAMLVGVLLVGTSAYGSRRWLDAGGLSIQASEVAKLLVIIVLAKFLADRHQEVSSLGTFLVSLAIAAVPMGLVLAEPDMGTAIIFGAAWLGMVVVAGCNPQHILVFLATLTLSIPFVVLGVMGDYQRERIAVFLNPEADPLGGGFQILQAEISVGSGGIFGKGFTEGTQTQLDYLQTPTRDYIFSVLGEELGLLGALLLFALFAFLLFRGLRAASLARDPFGRLIATGIVLMILIQVFINVAVNIRLLPVTGIPLPFISSGGSSLITLFVALGVLESILLRHRQIDF